MQLLQKSQINDAKAINLAREAQRNIDMENAAKQIRQDLAKAQADFADTMAKFKETWSQEEQAHETRRREMKVEINDLEEKKRHAGEHVIEELRELLEERLTDVGDREQKVRDKEIRLGLREQGIIAQENLMKTTR